eukprot:gnl/MRDRNA2_/MRDRNA2_120389_c0_seq1.p1 gnl/MRDRNA2_/MRDRNA2_120389_c0~~gnl/MRDRNA2_/MRDRNA2_120389_c0_seq1.p1  ORF type:complete len:183 (-),score=16.54 gnl/MRDRNA2_/MRDRNA2_120389_c0_seq1:606-1154(-)
MVHVILAVQKAQRRSAGSRGRSTSSLAPRTSSGLSRSQNSRELPQKQRSSHTEPRPVKVVFIQTQTIKPRGYEVVGTTLGGNEVCRLKVLNPRSFLLSDLYQAIEKNTDSLIGDLCLVTNDGGMLPGHDQVLTLEDALTQRHNLEPVGDKETAAQRSTQNKWGASLRKLMISITSRGKKAQQ